MKIIVIGSRAYNELVGRIEKIVEVSQRFRNQYTRLIHESEDYATNQELQAVSYTHLDALVAAANKEQGRILREAMEERDKIVHEARKQAEIAAQKELCLLYTSRCV